MKKELIDELAYYLGELMYQRDLEHDWIKKDAIIEKINAINILLGIDRKEKTWFQKVSENINLN